MKKSFLLFLLVWAVSCKTEDTPVTPVTPPITTPTTPVVEDILKTTATFPMGVAINPSLLANNKTYRDLILKEHNSITVENAMKWGTIHTSENGYNFADADYIVNFASDNKIRVHGHTLLWHAYNPGWLNNFKGDSTAWEGLMKNHIKEVAGHYKGKLAGWDVVNEAYNDAGGLRTGLGSEGSIWATKLGDDYIARAFQYAAEADPNALLFYNDYGQEYSASKLRIIVSMVKDLQRRKIPIHGVGLQFHISIKSNITGIETALKDLVATGLKIHISELDVNFSNFQKDASITFSESNSLAQKKMYKQVMLAYRKIVPVAQQYGVTCWNVGDADSWLRSAIQTNEWPLPFDDGYQRKPAYFGIIEGLKE
jgi:endo-1,4-beta-xylanase